MGFSVITSAASHHRVARGRDWLKARAPTEEILIIGATLGAANELARRFGLEDCPMVHLDKSGEIDCYFTETGATVVPGASHH
jgi:hypothetical protein